VELEGSLEVGDNVRTRLYEDESSCSKMRLNSFKEKFREVEEEEQGFCLKYLEVERKITTLPICMSPAINSIQLLISRRSSA
jgi:hypothetical protein